MTNNGRQATVLRLLVVCIYACTPAMGVAIQQHSVPVFGEHQHNERVPLHNDT